MAQSKRTHDVKRSVGSKGRAKIAASKKSQRRRSRANSKQAAVIRLLSRQPRRDRMTVGSCGPPPDQAPASSRPDGRALAAHRSRSPDGRALAAARVRGRLRR